MTTLEAVTGLNDEQLAAVQRGGTHGSPTGPLPRYATRSTAHGLPPGTARLRPRTDSAATNEVLS